MLEFRSIAGVLAIAMTVAACSAGSSNGATSDQNDTSAATPSATPPGAAPPAPSTPSASADAASTSAFAPAFQSSVPHLLFNGGPVLTSPTIVTVTFDDDPNAPSYEALDDAIGASNYWHAITSEYGVGPAKSGGHVRDANTIQQIDIDSLDDLVASRASDPSSGWPAPTSETLYVLFMPSSATVTEGGSDACTVEGGHHTSTVVNGLPVAYAVVLQCEDDDGALDTTEVTLAASHEIGEASLDPIQSSLAWATIDENHIAWDLMLAFQNENADLCEFLPEAELANPEPSIPFTVQRQWSNASAAAGHDPCVPVPPQPYFNVTPLHSDAITVDLTNLVDALADADFTDTSETGTHRTLGLQLDATGSAVLDLGFFSDAPTDAWNLEVYEMDPFSVIDDQSDDPFPPTTAPTVTVSLDKATGKNGDTATLTVHRSASTPTPIGASLLILKSTLGTTTHKTPLLVGGT